MERCVVHLREPGPISREPGGTDASTVHKNVEGERIPKRIEQSLEHIFMD